MMEAMQRKAEGQPQPRHRIPRRPGRPDKQKGWKGRGAEAQDSRQNRQQRFHAELDDDEVEAPDGDDQRGEKNLANGRQIVRGRVNRRAPKTLSSSPANTKMLPTTSIMVMTSPSSR